MKLNVNMRVVFCAESIMAPAGAYCEPTGIRTTPAALTAIFATTCPRVCDLPIKNADLHQA